LTLELNIEMFGRCEGLVAVQKINNSISNAA